MGWLSDTWHLSNRYREGHDLGRELVEAGERDVTGEQILNFIEAEEGGESLYQEEADALLDGAERGMTEAYQEDMEDRRPWWRRW